LPLHGLGQALVLQKAASEFAKNFPDGLVTQIEHPDQTIQLLPECKIRIPNTARHPGKIKFNGRELLAKLIMNFAGNPLSFFFANLL
jgi:hypothetical protein